MNRLKLILALLFLWNTVPAKALSSSTDIEWSEASKRSIYTKIYHVKNKDFYMIGTTGALLDNSMTLSYYSNFEQTNSAKINRVIQGKKADIEGIIINEGKFVVFLSKESGSKNLLYYQIYDESCTPLDDPKEIASLEKYKRKEGGFNIIQSKDKSKFCIDYIIPVNKKDFEMFGYKVFNSDFSLIKEGEYKSEYSSYESDFSNHYLSNSGDYFMILTVYKVNSKGKVKDKEAVDKMVLCHVDGKELEETTMDLGDGKVINNIELTSDNNGLFTCTGLYIDNKGQGVFYFQLNYKDKVISNSGFSAFDKKFMAEELSNREINKAEKRESKGQMGMYMKHYVFRETHQTQDGGLVVVMEKTYITTETTTDSRGVTRTTYVYHYDDIIAYKVEKGGKINWIKRIHKVQTSRNDGGMFSSFRGYFNGDEYVFYFNDNLGNYNESGDFEVEGYEKTMKLSKKKNCLAKITINLNSGNYKRESVTSRRETGMVAMPKAFVSNTSSSEMIFYFAIKKKQKFGYLKF